MWTERMVSALVNGVKGGRWFSLIDKVTAPATLQVAWAKVRANRGAAGVDGQSVERFERQAELYLRELADGLRDGSLPAAAGETGGDTERRWPDAAAGHTGG